MEKQRGTIVEQDPEGSHWNFRATMESQRAMMDR